MTSLEAFENVEDAVSSLGDFVREGIAHYSKEDIKNAYEGLHLIENDLKVLEILKEKQDVGKHLWLIEMVSCGEYKECFKENKAGRQEPDISEEEFDLIKRWLERE